ncbi:MAG: hypothetical protein J2O48_00260 [Solirubrobacterales bacterium]|nr:hypothetical protein [Solirubrobacterales bacterium]
MVFALKVDSAAAQKLSSTAEPALSANGADESDASVSGVSIVDPAGLKQYKTFMSKPSEDSTCLCSDTGSPFFVNSSPAAGTYMLAALVAAPPSNVKTVSVVTGLGSFANVPLT